MKLFRVQFDGQSEYVEAETMQTAIDRWHEHSRADLNLRGEMCNEPCCRFCRRTMAEVAEYLDVLLIRPRIDGVSVLVDEGTPLPPVSPQEPTGASPQSDMTQCDYCCTWRSRPCGEGCCWQPASLAPVEPTPEPETCEWREWNADGYGKPACRPTNSGTNWHRSLAAQMKKCPECGKPLRLVPSEEPK